jgi:hypothetical protein
MTLPNKRAIAGLRTDVNDLTVNLASFGVTNLADVEITNLTNGQILKWDSTDSVWKNAADAT